MDVFERFEEIGIIPVVVLEDAKDALPLGKALMEGGLPAAEVTFRTAAAEESIRILAKEYPDMLVGAGTVLTPEQADRAVAAGAKFVVSPGLDKKLVKHCLKNNIPVCPGTQTASEMMAALKLGLTKVKFFPAENAGGLKMIKAIGAALTALRFMPTGGISENNVREYLADPKIFCCGGSWMVKGDMIRAGNFDEIKEKVAAAAAIVKEQRAK
ncbi:MAG: bifunctional 4-hydroxy-2-oxoglutarate aldolase/2-dehydro-3-deoxy-phosphogluconate aldolase [Lachnospiraceae bacterium]|nr:bifunctional 4-hydroxy-2-oxoglutarate aldolase/2-dehydro-3-deoxy-phosphogluconate aldolase [Lachnospiraceae bacterium]